MNDIYMDSEILNAKVKYSPSLGLVVVDEKNSLDKRITYTMDEMKILYKNGYAELPKEIHMMKSVFSGMIVEYTPNESTPENIKKEYLNQSEK